MKALKSALAKALLADPDARAALRKQSSDVPADDAFFVIVKKKNGQVVRYKATPVPKAA
jgi:hypothetical protein